MFFGIHLSVRPKSQTPTTLVDGRMSVNGATQKHETLSTLFEEGQESRSHRSFCEEDGRANWLLSGLTNAAIRNYLGGR